jgi:hypothetical protein
MYCSSCGKLIADGVQFCSSCGNPAGAGALPAERRPIAGIAVGAIFGVVGLIWSIAAIFKSLYNDPAGVEAALYQAFPALQGTSFFGAPFGLLGNSALLIGVLLAFLGHPKGHRTGRITSYCTFAAIIVLFAVSYFAVTGASVWQTLDAPTKGSLIGGLSGGIIGGVLQWGLSSSCSERAAGHDCAQPGASPDRSKAAFLPVR